MVEHIGKCGKQNKTEMCAKMCWFPSSHHFVFQLTILSQEQFNQLSISHEASCMIPKGIN